MTALDRIVQQLSEIVGDLNDSTNARGFIEPYDTRRISTRARAAIRRFGPPMSAYEEDAKEVVDESASPQWKAEQLVAIVQALRDDYAVGGLIGVEEVVHADLFDDFLSMALELLEKGFVAPASVMAGSVLEEHLKKLALRHQVELSMDNGRPKPVEVLSIDLRKIEAVTEVQRKSIVAWYAQRNEAAHGRTDDLSAEDIKRSISGVRDFVANHPA